jgi:hypothetical protein
MASRNIFNNCTSAGGSVSILKNNTLKATVFDVTSAISAFLKWQLVKGLYSWKWIKIAGSENMVIQVALQYHATKVTAA